MSEPYLGQIILVGWNFAARGYAKTEGQLLPISSNSALFSLLGTTYGGDGRTSFGLPDTRGRTPVGYGNGPGLRSWRLGERQGSETTTLTVANMPSHNHGVLVTNLLGDKTGPGGKLLAAAPIIPGHPTGDETIYSDDWPLPEDKVQRMRPEMIDNTGGSQSFNNIQPTLALNYQIALQGLFPSRN